MRIVLFTIGLFLLTIVYVLYPIPSFAQQISLSISPPLLKVFIKPGKSIMIAYKLENTGDPSILLTKVLPFEPADDKGTIRIKSEFEGPIRFNLDNADFALGQPFFMKTRDSQQLLLRIRIPDGAPVGDYYYTLLAETTPPPTLEGAGSAGAKATIGSNILITVTKSGTIDVIGKIGLFDVLSRYTLKLFGNAIKIFDSNDKIPVVLIVENKGKNLFVPEGQIVLKGGFGEKAQYDIIPQNVLAQSQRLMTASDSAEFDRPITLLIPGFFVGLYKLSTTLNFGENSPNIFAATSFIAIPFKLIIGFLIALIIGIFIVKRLKDSD
ncbi:hypothetical protein HY041_02255 [Candidatus Roizmanbacteria bacterium]|nr:hypothetical protein [Candidatus Roizmanbacteria bacterium]